MRDRELYATILGVQAPWTVETVELDVAGGAVHVRLVRAEGAPAECPTCHTPQPIYDHREREWRHLDTCQLSVVLINGLTRLASLRNAQSRTLDLLPPLLRSPLNYGHCGRRSRPAPEKRREGGEPTGASPG